MPIASPGGSRSERVADGLAILALAAVAAVALTTFRDFGMGWDDFTQAQYGDLLVSLFGSGFADQRALHFVNLYAYGGGFDLLSSIVAGHLPFSLWETRRLCGALVGLVGLAATWRAGRRLGGPWAGLLALLLLATCPLYIGHMFINPKDGPFATAMAVLLLGIVRALLQYPRPSPGTIALAGIGIGCAVGTRVLGGFGVIVAILALLYLVAIEWLRLGPQPAAKRLGTFALALIPMVVLGYAVLALIWPWGVVDPLNPFRAAAYFSTFFEKPWRELFAGSLILVPDMPRTYLPHLLALKLPEVLLALGLAGIVTTLAMLAGRARPQRRAALLAVLLFAVLPVAVTLVTRPAMYNGIRHFVFVVPPLAVLGGIAGAASLRWLWARSQALGAVAAIAVVAALALPVVHMARLHPYEYTYFNAIAGGVRGAANRYMLDYWGVAFKQAAEALRAQIVASGAQPPAGGRWRVATCGPQAPATVELGPQFDVTWEPEGAQWAMTLGTFYCRKLDAPVIAEIAREGVVYARVYDLRGRTIPSLLTIPAP